MNLSSTVHGEVLSVASVLHHGGRITTHQHRLAGGETVVVIQQEAVLMPGNGTAINGNLAVIFTNIFQIT